MKAWSCWPDKAEHAGANPVGASLLAKNVNDDACFLNTRGVYEFFASKN